MYCQSRDGFFKHGNEHFGFMKRTVNIHEGFLSMLLLSYLFIYLYIYLHDYSVYSHLMTVGIVRSV